MFSRETESTESISVSLSICICMCRERKIDYKELIQTQLERLRNPRSAVSKLENQESWYKWYKWYDGINSILSPSPKMGEHQCTCIGDRYIDNQGERFFFFFLTQAFTSLKPSADHMMPTHMWRTICFTQTINLNVKFTQKQPSKNCRIMSDQISGHPIA